MPHVAPPALDAAHVVARDLLVLIGRVRRRIRDLAPADDLTPSQASVLARLEKDGDSSTSTLAVIEGVRPQSMAATVSALEARGLVSRRPDPEDGRRQLISLSNGGADQLMGDRQERDEWLARVIQERYSPDQLAVIAEALDLLHDLAQS